MKVLFDFPPRVLLIDGRGLGILSYPYVPRLFFSPIVMSYAIGSYTDTPMPWVSGMRRHGGMHVVCKGVASCCRWRHDCEKGGDFIGDILFFNSWNLLMRSFRVGWRKNEECSLLWQYWIDTWTNSLLNTWSGMIHLIYSQRPNCILEMSRNCRKGR